MMTLELSKRRDVIKEVILNVLALALLVFVMTKNIGFDNMTALMNDEFGYWGNAVALTDINWEPLREQTPYFSNGYSIILALLITIMKSSSFADIYQVAVCVNIVFICVAYLCTYYCCRILFEKDSVKATLVALASNFLVGNLFYVHMTWPEAMITMLMWIFVALFISLVKKFSWVKTAIACAVLVMLYITHQRALGIFVVFFIALVLVLIKNKKKLWFLIPVVAGLALAFAIQVFADSFVAHADGVANSATNNLTSKPTGIIEKYVGLVLDHFLLFVYSFAGKLFCMGITSLGLAIIPVISLCSRIIKMIKAKKLDLSDEFIIEFFIVCSFLVMLAMNAVMTLPASRKDLIVYSRYMEYTIGPLFVLMFKIFLKEGRKYRWWIVVSFIYTGATSLLIQYRFMTVPAGFSLYCSPLIGSFFRLCNNDERIVPFLCVILVIFALVLITSIATLKGEKTKAAALLVVFIFANFFSYYYALEQLRRNRDHYHTKIDPICAQIEAYPEDYKIYFIKDDENFKYSMSPKYLQFMLKERTIDVVDNASKLPQSGHYLVLTNYSKETKYYNGEVLEHTDLLDLFIVNG